MKQLEVQIMGQSYLLGCPDGGDNRLLDAVERVDTAMCKIRDAGKVRARERIAVLAALNLAFELSDRGAVATPAAQPPVIEPVLATAVTSSPVAPSSLERDPVLASLLARLDDALSDDGQLI